MTFWKVLLHPKNLPTWVALAAALVSGFLLFARSLRFGPLHLDDFVAAHERTIALLFLGSLAFLAVGGLVLLVERIAGGMRYRQRLAILDVAEKAILREFVLQGRNTIAAPANDLAVAGLLTDGLLAQVGGQVQQTPRGLVAAVRIDPAAKKHLTPEAIGLTGWTPAESERRRLLDTRPAFVGEVARWDAIFQL